MTFGKLGLRNGGGSKDDVRKIFPPTGVAL